MNKLVDCSLVIDHGPNQSLGKPINLGFSVGYEDGSDPIYILTHYTPLHGHHWEFYRVTCNGCRVPFDGYRRKPKPPKTFDFTNPGIGYTTFHFLNDSYRISETGLYEVWTRFDLHIYDKPFGNLLQVYPVVEGITFNVSEKNDSGVQKH